MSRRRNRFPKDSLDLLLDTMCNAFGGIVMMAILIALLIQPDGVEAPPDKPDAVNPESPEKRERLRVLRELEGEVSSLEAFTKANAEWIELSKLRNQLKAQIESRDSNAALSKVALHDRRTELKEELSSAADNLKMVSSELASLSEELARATSRESKMKEQISDFIQSKSSEIRPPELRDSSGMQYNLIVQHGKIYPIVDHVFDPSTGEFYGSIENTIHVKWDGGRVTPIPGKGYKIGRDKDQLVKIFTEISIHNKRNIETPSRQFYIISFVYGDSFDVIDELRLLIQNAGDIEDGWEPQSEGSILSFGSAGKRGQTD